MSNNNFIYQWLTQDAETKAHGVFLYNRRKRQISIRLFQVSILVFFFGLWEVAAHMEWINTFLMSQPSQIWHTFTDMVLNGKLFHHLQVTMTEHMIGFVSGTIMGTLIAIALWWSEYLYNLFEPYIVILNSIPKIALGPVIIVWLGNGPQAIIAMSLLISIIVTIMMLINGFQEVEENKVKLLKTLGASKRQILFKVILPASIPTIFSALKVGVGLSLVGTIVGEYLVSKAGLGYLIIYGGQVFNLHLVMMSVLLLSIIAGLLYYLILLLENWIVKWK